MFPHNNCLNHTSLGLSEEEPGDGTSPSSISQLILLLVSEFSWLSEPCKDERQDKPCTLWYTLSCLLNSKQIKTTFDENLVYTALNNSYKPSLNFALQFAQQKFPPSIQCVGYKSKAT